jgi:formate dehydrogenase major subunit
LDESQFSYASPSDVFDEMARVTPILGGLSHARLEAEGGIQWPCPTLDHPGTPNLYTENFPRPNGLARLTPVRQGVAAMELPDDEYPLVLNTGRVLYHWHGGTITTRVDGLVDLAPEVNATLHPEDAGLYGIHHGDPVRLTSRRVTVVCTARVTREVAPGEVFMPFVSLSGTAANFLTNNVYDPNGMPEYKVCAVRIDAVSA